MVELDSVDPVRSRFTGHLYERHAIYEAIRRMGRDPQSGQLATKLDYVSCPLARNALERYGTLLDAHQVAIVG
jgi:hypothetical protein